AGGRHLVQTWHLAELALQRRRDGRRYDVRTRAGIEGDDLDCRIVYLRQRRHRQLLVGNRSNQQQTCHQQRGRNRSEDEWSRGIHISLRFARSSRSNRSKRSNRLELPPPVGAREERGGV